MARTGGSVKIPLLRAGELRTLHTFLGSSTCCLLLREQFEENAEEKRNYKKKRNWNFNENHLEYLPRV